MAILNLTDIQKLRIYIMDGEYANENVPRTFSDDELETFLSWHNNSIVDTALYCIDRLIMQASKRFSYKQGETEVDFAQVVKQLKEARKQLQSMKEDGQDIGGGMQIVGLNSPYIKEGDETTAIGEVNFDRLTKTILQN